MAVNVKVSLVVVFALCLLFASAVLAGHEAGSSQKCVSDTCVELLEEGLN